MLTGAPCVLQAEVMWRQQPILKVFVCERPLSVTKDYKES